MRIINYPIFLVIFFTNIHAFAQSPQAIDRDLSNSFKKIGYWDERKNADTSYTPAYDDSLEVANEVFGKKLQYYAANFPSTLTQKFARLAVENLTISSSGDGLFRIYSWDTLTGGTMHFFENVFQYKSGNKTFAVIDTPREEGDFRPAYDKILTVTCGLQQVYVSRFLFIESSRYHDEGIQIFKIEGNKLNNRFKAIKTKAGLHSQVSYEYDLSYVKDMNNIPSIIFDSSMQTIKLPIVGVKGRFTNRFITYIFNGQYFERVKS